VGYPSPPRTTSNDSPAASTSPDDLLDRLRQVAPKLHVDAAGSLAGFGTLARRPRVCATNSTLGAMRFAKHCVRSRERAAMTLPSGTQMALRRDPKEACDDRASGRLVPRRQVEERRRSLAREFRTGARSGATHREGRGRARARDRRRRRVDLRGASTRCTRWPFRRRRASHRGRSGCVSQEEDGAQRVESAQVVVTATGDGPAVRAEGPRHGTRAGRRARFAPRHLRLILYVAR